MYGFKLYLICEFFAIYLLSKLHRHDDVVKWKHLRRHWPFVRRIHRSSVNSPHKGQRAGALMYSLICVWASGWVNKWNAGDLRHHRTHYDVTVMALSSCCLAGDMLPLVSEITRHYLREKPLPESMGINFDNIHSIKWYRHGRYETMITFAAGLCWSFS